MRDVRKGLGRPIRGLMSGGLCFELASGITGGEVSGTVTASTRLLSWQSMSERRSVRAGICLLFANGEDRGSGCILREGAKGLFSRLANARGKDSLVIDRPCDYPKTRTCSFRKTYVQDLGFDSAFRPTARPRNQHNCFGMLGWRGACVRGGSPDRSHCSMTTHHHRSPQPKPPRQEQRRRFATLRSIWILVHKSNSRRSGMTHNTAPALRHGLRRSRDRSLTFASSPSRV